MLALRPWQDVLNNPPPLLSEPSGCKTGTLIGGHMPSLGAGDLCGSVEDRTLPKHNAKEIVLFHVQQEPSCNSLICYLAADIKGLLVHGAW